MAKEITWLHLSDLHLCEPETGFDSNLVLEKLRTDLLRLHEMEGLSPDFIFFTGDAAFGHLKDEAGLRIRDQFADAWFLFEQIREIFNPPVKLENVFLVPGNHDVNRSKIYAPTTHWLNDLRQNGWSNNAADRITKMIQSKDKEWHDCMERLLDYRDFLGMSYKHLLQDSDRLIFGHIRQVGSVKVGIAGMNSAWSCTDDDKARLWLGGHWQMQTLGKKIRDVDISVGLIHHPINWLTEVEDPHLGPEFERTFNFLLHGHEHQGWVNRQNHHTRIAGGAAYDRSDKKNGYNVVRLDLEQNICEIWLREYDNQGGGWVANNIFEKTDQRGVWLIDNFLPNRNSPEMPPQTPSPIQEEEVDDPIQEQENSDQIPDANSPESRGVFGRTQTLKNLAEKLNKNAILAVYGLGGIGKTDLVREIQYLPEYQSFRYMEIYAYPDTNIKDLYRPIAVAMGSREEDPTIPKDNFGFLDFSDLGELLHLPTLIHVHRAHHLFTPYLDRYIKEFFQALLKYVPNIKLILESRTTPPESEVYSTFRVTGLDSNNVKEYFETKPLRRKPEIKWSTSEEDAEYIFGRLGGNYKRDKAHPLSLLLLATVADGQQTTPVSVLRRNESLLWQQLEDHLFNEIYDTILSESERHMLRICALYREPIPDLHVDLLNDHIGEMAFGNLVRRCLLSSDERGENYTLHQIVAELALRRMKRGSSEEFESHELIAEAWLNRVKGKSRISLPNLLAAGEAAYHFSQAGSFDSLDNLSLTLLGQRKLLPVLDRWSDVLYEQGELRNEKRILELIVSIDPENAKAHNYLGLRIEDLTRKGNPEALEHFEIACALTPDHPISLANLGNCYLARNEPEKFLEYIDNLSSFNRRRVLSNDRYFVTTIYTTALQKVGRETDASKIRRTAIENKSTNPAFYADEAVYQRDLKGYSGALAILDQAANLGIENEYLVAIRASILDAKGERKAASNVRMAQIEAGTADAFFYNEQANYLKSIKQYDAAYSIINLAYKRGVTNDRTESSFYSILKAEKDPKKSAKFRQSKIDDFTKEPIYYNEEAQYQYQLGNVSKAKGILALAERRGVANDTTKSLIDKWQDGQE